jgi:hypothetical protein
MTVKVDDEMSEPISLNVGTPQGSIIAPLLYLMYVNDMSDCIDIEKCEIYQFADDTAIISASKNVRLAEQNIQECYNSICKWAHDKELVINESKTQIMHIHSHRNKSTYKVSVQSHSHACLHQVIQKCPCPKLSEVQSCKYLGITIDNHLNFKPHIENVCKRLRSMNAVFKVIRPKLTYDAARLLYIALCDSVVSYGLSSYGLAYKTNLEKISVIQKKNQNCHR